LEVGTIGLPSGATRRWRLPRRWKRIGIRTTSVVPSSRFWTPLTSLMPPSPLQLADQAREPFSPDPQLQRVLLDVHAFDEQLDDPRPFGREQSVRAVAKSAGSTLTSRSVISYVTLSLGRRPGWG
jgi:hypothetical protein